MRGCFWLNLFSSGIPTFYCYTRTWALTVCQMLSQVVGFTGEWLKSKNRCSGNVWLHVMVERTIVVIYLKCFLCRKKKLIFFNFCFVWEREQELPLNEQFLNASSTLVCVRLRVQGCTPASGGRTWAIIRCIVWCELLRS